VDVCAARVALTQARLQPAGWTKTKSAVVFLALKPAHSWIHKYYIKALLPNEAEVHEKYLADALYNVMSCNLLSSSKAHSTSCMVLRQIQHAMMPDACQIAGSPSKPKIA
jgi:hypothetical protein